MSYFSKKLKEKEVLIRIIRPYSLMLFIPILISAILIIGGAFFSYYLIQKGTWGVVALILIFLFGFYYLIRILFVYHFKCLILTDQRIINIHQKGFFDRWVSELEIIKISDISYRIRGFLGTLFHFGNIQIQSNDAIQPLKIEFKKLKNPGKIQELILVLKKQAEDKISKLPKEENRLLSAEEISSRTSTQEIFKLIKKFKEDMGEEKFEEILNKISESND